MRIALVIVATFGFVVGAAADDSGAFENLTRAPQGGFADHAHAKSLNPTNFQCHKDHAGLDLEPAETAEDARSRLADALDDGGALIVGTVGGLDCAYCASALERAFASRDDVASVYVDVRAQRVLIVAQKDADLSDRAIARIVKRRGYRLVAIDRRMQLPPGATD